MTDPPNAVLAERARLSVKAGDPPKIRNTASPVFGEQGPTNSSTGHRGNTRDPRNIKLTPGTQLTSLNREPDDVDPRKPGDPPWRSRAAHRSCDPKAAEVLRLHRLRRGWTVSEASRQSGVSRRMIGLLEHAQRRTSVSLAEALIDAYGIQRPLAGVVRAIALPDVGRDSPYKVGVMTSGW
jgi:hypothetical protein